MTRSLIEHGGLREAALRLKQSGLSHKAIAIELDTSESYLSQLIGRRHSTRRIAGLTVRQWAAKTHITPDGIYKRLRNGWDPVKAVTREARSCVSLDELNERFGGE